MFVYDSPMFVCCRCFASRGLSLLIRRCCNACPCFPCFPSLCICFCFAVFAYPISLRPFPCPSWFFYACFCFILLVNAFPCLYLLVPCAVMLSLSVPCFFFPCPCFHSIWIATWHCKMAKESPLTHSLYPFKTNRRKMVDF